MELLKFIEDAFHARVRPPAVIAVDQPATELRSDALAVACSDWRELTCDMLDKYPDCVHGFSPTAFCYFLPGIFSAGIRERRADLLVNHSLITGLDRSNSPASWDDFFRARWPRLTPSECEAAQRWILWLEEFEPAPIADASLSRAYDTLETLANQSIATPIADRSLR